jgi:hypothetical protein
MVAAVGRGQVSVAGVVESSVVLKRCELAPGGGKRGDMAWVEPGAGAGVHRKSSAGWVEGRTDWVNFGELGCE